MVNKICCQIFPSSTRRRKIHNNNFNLHHRAPLRISHLHKMRILFRRVRRASTKQLLLAKSAHQSRCKTSQCSSFQPECLKPRYQISPLPHRRRNCKLPLQQDPKVNRFCTATPAMDDVEIHFFSNKLPSTKLLNKIWKYDASASPSIKWNLRILYV